MSWPLAFHNLYGLRSDDLEQHVPNLSTSVTGSNSIVSELARAIAEAAKYNQLVSLNPYSDDIVSLVTSGGLLLAYVWDLYYLEIYLCEDGSLKGSTPIASYCINSVFGRPLWHLSAQDWSGYPLPTEGQTSFELALGWQNILIENVAKKSCRNS